MSDLAEDRVYSDDTDDDTAFLATGAGVARVAVANGRVGRFDLPHRCDATDVAAAPGPDGPLVAVATDEDVLVHHGGVGDEWVPTGFGVASAVGLDHTDAGGPALVAVTAEEHVVRRVLHPREDPTDWLEVADVDAPVRAVEGPFLGAADGCYRVTPDGVEDVGLDDVRDVAVVRAEGGDWADTDALAATGDGLHRLAPGVEGTWERDLAGAFDAVAALGARAVAVGSDDAYLHGEPGESETADDGAAGGWHPVDVPQIPVTVGVGQAAYGVTAEGTFLAREETGWRTRALGFPDVLGMTVVPGADAE